jgi:hypothetical protein
LGEIIWCKSPIVPSGCNDNFEFIIFCTWQIRITRKLSGLAISRQLGPGMFNGLIN